MTEYNEGRLKFSKKVPISFYGLEWIQAAIDRAAMSYYRHKGKTSHFSGKGMSPIAHAMQRAKWYKKTGNKEWLIDVLNFVIRELQHPSHSKTHWNPEAPHPEDSLWKRSGERE